MLERAKETTCNGKYTYIIPDHQPQQTGADRNQPKASADGPGVETLEHEGKANRLAPGEANSAEKKPQPDSC
jgi:hypothetical protein